MTRSTLFGICLLALGACTPAQPATGPAPAASPASPPVREPDEALAAAPGNWWLLDDSTDHVVGISADRAYRELLAGKQIQDTVTVAIIDSGIDITHEDLRDNLWTNPREIPGNGKDDDGNGYVDDVHGWDFIGGPGGKDVEHDTYELTRLYGQLHDRCEGTGAGSTECAEYPKIKTEFENRRTEAEQTLQQVQTIGAAFELLQSQIGGDSLSMERVAALQATRPDVAQAKQIYLRLASNGVSASEIAEARKEYEGQLQYGLNPSFNPRPIVGDDYQDATQRVYGNADVVGPDPFHGTHVAGIVAAERGNGIGVDGIAPAAHIMVIRAVPDGDERDKDIANAIRYAVDNGARIINMSFGKGYSPRKDVVDDAVRYADSKGVLLVHAAGNEAADQDSANNFPNRFYLQGDSARNWIEVGASSWQGAGQLAAPFSDYSRTRVQVFAPGVDIRSTVPGNAYRPASGTSMAAPVVTGLAALILDYYPKLSAAEVKRIILDSATRYPEQLVTRPGREGEREQVRFGELSATGGVVNAYRALQMAEEMSRGR